jgi:hypothetical protein
MVDYVLDGRPGVIDGWLQNDDRVRIEPREGAKRLVQMDGRAGNEYWNPHAAVPATQATQPASSDPPR